MFMTTQASSTVPLLSFELYPVQESTALHTLLETVVSSSVPLDSRRTKVSCDLVQMSCDLSISLLQEVHLSQ